MKTDLNAIKEELRKLTDLEYLKQELGKITVDLKKFDLNVALTPQAKKRLKTLEKRFNDIRKRMQLLQKQVDTEVNKFINILRRTKATTEERLRRSGLGGIAAKKGRKKTSKKSARKKTSSRKTARSAKS